MKILAGIYLPDEGELLLNGQPVHFSGVADALKHGISLIHQELNLAETLSVAANLFLGREAVRGGVLGWLDRGAMDREARQLLARVGLDVSPRTEVSTLNPGQKQLVEIARALGMNAHVIIMDEPTSSLTQTETNRLFEVVRDLRRHGVAIVYISHRLAEVREIADRVVVLRDGKYAGALAKDEISHDNLVRLMVGRDLKQLYPHRHGTPGPVRLEVQGLKFERSGETPISLTLRGGEVVGLAGLVGAGRTELAEALFGIRTILDGEVRLDGQPLRVRHPDEAVRAGLLLVPEDRRLHGLLLESSIRANFTLPNLDRISVLRLLRPGAERELSRRMSERLHVKAASLSSPAGLLSGGNQQKIVLGKWLARQPRVLILDEPTRGVDVGARSEIYALIDELAVGGVAVLMISSDMEEVLGMSDRVLVMFQGRITGELRRDQLSETVVMNLATGNV